MISYHLNVLILIIIFHQIYLPLFLLFLLPAEEEMEATEEASRMKASVLVLLLEAENCAAKDGSEILLAASDRDMPTPSFESKD